MEFLLDQIRQPPAKQHLQWMPPKKGCQIKVIGAGMPRTATNSFCAAVSQLLDGPSYHVGVQTVTGGDETHIKNWISIIQNRVSATGDKKLVLDTLRRELDGYVMATDPPVQQLVPEVLELYPDAVVIVTTRDRKSWAVSLAKLIGLIKFQTMEAIYFWLRSLRLAPKLWRLLEVLHIDTYGDRMVADVDSVLKGWDQHMEFLERVVPKEKLFFYDVKEGWEPLCEILNVPVPEDVPFPRLNDAKAIEDAFKNLAVQGLIIWGTVLGVAVGGLSIAAYAMYCVL